MLVFWQWNDSIVQTNDAERRDERQNHESTETSGPVVLPSTDGSSYCFQWNFSPGWSGKIVALTKLTLTLFYSSRFPILVSRSIVSTTCPLGHPWWPTHSILPGKVILLVHTRFILQRYNGLYCKGWLIYSLFYLYRNYQQFFFSATLLSLTFSFCLLSW